MKATREWSMRSRSGSFTVAAAILVTAACSGGDSGAARDTSATATPGTSAPAAPVSTVPADIEAIGHHGENAYDMAKLADWAKATASLDSLERAIATGANGTGDSAVRSAVADLRRSIAAKDRRAAMIAANRLTEVGARLSVPFAPIVPADVTLLDYYGRELEVWAATRNTEKLKETGDAIGETWDRLRPTVEQRGGTAEAKVFGDLVQRVRQARTAAEYGALATPVLDEVDKLEAVFNR